MVAWRIFLIMNQQPANASNGNATVTKKLADAYNRL